MSTLSYRVPVIALATCLLLSFGAVGASAATHKKKASHHSSQGKKKAHKHKAAQKNAQH